MTLAAKCKLRDKWFMMFQDTILSRFSRRYYISTNKILKNLEADRKLDIFFIPADIVLFNSKCDWSNILVIKEHK
jgi:hypothetical protein